MKYSLWSVLALVILLSQLGFGKIDLFAYPTDECGIRFQEVLKICKEARRYCIENVEEVERENPYYDGRGRGACDLMYAQCRRDAKNDYWECLFSDTERSPFDFVPEKDRLNKSQPQEN